MGFVVNWMLFVWWELEGCDDGLWEQKHKEEMAAAAAAGMVVRERKREERVGFFESLHPIIISSCQ